MNNIRALLEKKSNKKKNKLMLEDVNRNILMGLLGISIYGAEARDEEILTAIINSGSDYNPHLEDIRKEMETFIKENGVKKTKAGWIDSNGSFVLVPKKA